MKIKLLKNAVIAGKVHKKDAVVQVTDGQAENLIAGEFAEKAKAKEQESEPAGKAAPKAP